MNEVPRDGNLRNSNLIFTFLSLISVFFILFNWFKSGSIISNSEESLSIYNPYKEILLNESVWRPGELGFLMPYGLTRAPTFLVLSYLGDQGLSVYAGQALIIGFTMLVALLSSFALFKYLSNGSILVASFAAFFYLFNLYTQSQIFMRFLYNYFFLLAYYPLFIYLLLQILDKRQFKYIIAFLVSSVIFSFSFNNPATIFPFLLAAGFIAIIKIWEKKAHLKEVINILLLIAMTLTLSVLVNIWWIYPIFHGTGDYLVQNSQNSNKDLVSLEGVSTAFPVSQILLLRQSWWYGSSKHWYEFYNNPFVYMLSIAILIFCIYGIVKSKRLPYWSFLLFLFVIGLFISKGTNPPFGHFFFSKLFSISPALGALRNSYEKIGIVFLLPFAFFFAYGLVSFIKQMPKAYKNFAYLVLTFLLLGVLVWPTWFGNIFTQKDLVKVPEYYHLANQYLDSRPDGRLFHLPFVSTYSQNYDWGYSGQDPSEYLFDRTPLSNVLMEPLNTLFYKKLPDLAASEAFPKLLGFLSVGDIIVHRDSINKGSSVVLDNNSISNWKMISNPVNIGRLSIYKINPEIVRGRFYNLSSYTGSDFPNKIDLDGEFTNLRYTRVSPTKYHLKFTNVKSSFILVFNDLYNDSWQIKIGSKFIPDHFKAYGLVNGWRIDQTGDFPVEISLKLWPWD